MIPGSRFKMISKENDIQWFLGIFGSKRHQFFLS